MKCSKYGRTLVLYFSSTSIEMRQQHNLLLAGRGVSPDDADKAMGQGQGGWVGQG